MIDKNKSGFTLIELIVVITILAILGTIAFISLQGYSVISRDSVRISDTSNMKTSLELFHLNTGKYPLPDNYATVQYSLEDLFYQGTFGNKVVQSVGRNMNEVPTDPLTEQEYIYSVGSNKNELEILSLMESGDFALNTISETNAAGTEVQPKIIGNYNGLFIKTSTYIVPLPSIINTEATSGALLPLDSENIKSMVTHKGLNIPKQGNVVTNTGGLVNLLLTGALNNLDKTSSLSEKAAVIELIQSAYINEIELNTDGIIEYITTLGTDETVLAGLFDTKILNEPIAITNGLTIKTISDCGTSTGEVIYGTLEGTDVGLTCDDDIMVCNGTTGSGFTIAACNLGATEVGTGILSFGGLYQWGNNFDFRGNQFSDGEIYTLSGTTQVSVISDYSNFNSSIFIKQSDWTSLDFNCLLRSANWNPCKSGYYIPTSNEWRDLGNLKWYISTFNSLGSLFSSDLKLPMSGLRHSDFADLDLINSNPIAYLWGISIFIQSINGGPFYYEPSSFVVNDTFINSVQHGAGDGLAIRCFKY